jgi:hypothetical protein
MPVSSLGKGKGLSHQPSPIDSTPDWLLSPNLSASPNKKELYQFSFLKRRALWIIGSKESS